MIVAHRKHGMRGISVALSAAMLLAMSCGSEAPPPPAMPTAVATLAAQYESLTGQLDPALARNVVNGTLPIQLVLKALTGLQFVRDVVEDATSVRFDDSDFAIDVQGAIDAHTPCPGWTQGAAPDDATQGFIEVTIGLEASHLQRAFTGRATQCRFVAGQGDGRSNVIATMDLQVDLGRSLELGEAVSGILLRGTDISAAVDGIAVQFGSQVFSFRLNRDNSVETLIDLASLGIGLQGSALLGLREDGSWTLRARNAKWVCAAGGSEPCVLDSGA